MFKLFKKLFRRVDHTETTETSGNSGDIPLAVWRKQEAKRLFYEKHLSAQEVADHLGVARSTVYMYLEGVRSVNAGSNQTS